MDTAQYFKDADVKRGSDNVRKLLVRIQKSKGMNAIELEPGRAANGKLVKLNREEIDKCPRHVVPYQFTQVALAGHKTDQRNWSFR